MGWILASASNPPFKGGGKRKLEAGPVELFGSVKSASKNGNVKKPRDRQKMLSVKIDLKLISVANARLNRFKMASITRANRAKSRHRMQVEATPPSPPLSVILTRVGPRKLDSDNLASAFKAVRDGIADWLTVDDGSELIDWQYKQRQEGPGIYYIEIDVI